MAMVGDVDRNVTITFIGRDNASRAMNGIGSSASKTTGIVTKLTGALKVAGLAAAGALAAGAFLAVKALYDSVKAAYADDLAMKKLADTQMRAQDATKAQTKATADWIDQMELATRFADDDMRPALSALALTGMSVKRSQELLSVAMDVAEAKGKPLLTVAEALAKAYNGNTGSLGRLGVATKNAKGDALSFASILKTLKSRTEGAAKAAAKNDPWTVLGHAFDQVKEEVGQQFLPMLRRLMKYIINRVVPWVKEKLVPAIKKFSRWIPDKAVPFIRDKMIPALQDLYDQFNQHIKPFFDDTTQSGRDLWKSLNKLWQSIEDINEGSGPLSTAIDGIHWGFVALFSPLNAVLGVMQGFVDAMNWIIEHGSAFADSVGSWISKIPSGGLFNADGGYLHRAQGGWTMVGEHGPELINNKGFMRPHSASMGARAGGNVYVTVQGAVDPVSTARQIERILAKGRRVTGAGGLATA